MKHILNSPTHWQALAADAGQVGRWVWDPSAKQVLLDETLSEITGLPLCKQGQEADLFFQHIHPEDLPGVMAAADRDAVKSGGYKARFRFLRDDGRQIWLEGRGKHAELEDGSEVLIGVNYDISEHMGLVQANTLLMGEMNHRVKNTLALVGGIFRMTARSSTDIGALTEAFTGRLNALGTLNDFILGSVERSVNTRQLVDAIFEPLRDDARVTLRIAAFELDGPPAQALIMALNELFTNAVKHGALSDDEGRLDVSVGVDAARDMFTLEWEEVCTRPIAPPDKSDGFGLMVLQRMTRATAEGKPVVTWRDDGLSFRCEWRASSMGLSKASVT